MKYPGLTTNEVNKMFHKYGYNVIQEQNKRGFLAIVFDQIKSNFMVYFMVGASILSFAVGKGITGYSILGVILVIVIVGFIQEYKAESAVNALKNMLESFSTVIRDGKESQINSKELVPGDIILCETGEKVPADCIVIESKDLLLNESILTGESREIEKMSVSKTDQKDYKIENQVFMGTYIVNGRCVLKVLNTGMQTEFGKIAGMISNAEKELPLKHKVNRLVKFMAIIAIVVSTVSGVIMFYNLDVVSTENIIEILLISIALMISAFPEGLPVVMISTLAGGAYKMAQKKAIVNRMSIIETLGETTVVCSDKTGTITKGEMTAKQIITYNSDIEITGIGYETEGQFLENQKEINPTNNKVINMCLEGLFLCNNAHLINHKDGIKFKGTPTEIALIVLGHKAKILESVMGYERTEEIPFNSDRKMMSVVVEKNNKKTLYSKGAPEFFLKYCTKVQIGDQIVDLDVKQKHIIEEKIESLTHKKYRVLCVGYKNMENIDKSSELESNFVLLGMVGLHDSPREGVKDAIESCYGAGIKVKMITGDNKDTAVAIARDVGIVGDVITGSELDMITDEQLKDRVLDIAVFARVKPDHKLRIVKALKSLGEIVTMTGDGVNDAPALKEAHIGVAMGINGTDVSREASDLILKDDNFVTIVTAIEEGRTIFKNIQKFVVYQLSCNIAELAIIFFAVLFGMPAPLIAIQILFMNLVTDNLPALTLGFTKGSGFIMQVSARRNSNILDTRKKILMISIGLFMALVCLIVYYITYVVWNRPFLVSSTTVLLTLIMFEVTNAFNFRSMYLPFHKIDFKRNTKLIYASIISILATMAIIYIPFLQKIFETESLDRNIWFITFGISLSIIFFVDMAKYINNKFFLNKENV